MGDSTTFKDPHFPPDDRSWRSNKNHGKRRNSLFDRDDIEWLPIEKIHSDPKICTRGCYVKPGEQRQVGNCTFIAAIFALQMNEFHYKQVIPERRGSDQSFTFWFCPKRGAERVPVKIDRYLPTRNRKLVAARHENPAEFSVPLLEKAYIKFRKTTYEGIEGVDMAEVLEHFTGCPFQTYHPASIVEWRNLLLRGQQRNSMMVIGSISEERGRKELTPNNIYGSHAYTVVGVQGDKIILRNPWGTEPVLNGTKLPCGGPFVMNERQTLDCQTSDGVFPISFDVLERSFACIATCEQVHTGAENVHAAVPSLLITGGVIILIAVLCDLFTSKSRGSNRSKH